MNRRTFLATATALACVPFAAQAEFVDFVPGTIDNALAEGKTVLVDYAADWCTTCARQERVINALRAAEPSYDDAMMFVRVDWDTYGYDEVAVSRDIPRRSTLILLRGDDELGRIVAQTGETQIKALLDLGLDAGS